MAKNPAVKAGDVIVWTHYDQPGGRKPFERIGTVWSGAPTGNGLENAWWVFPADPEPGETLAGGALVVGRNSRSRYYRPRTWAERVAAAGKPERKWSDPGPDKGEVYGSWWWADQPAALTASAAVAQARIAGKTMSYEDAIAA